LTFNKDFDKFKIEDNLYPQSQMLLEDETDLILVKPNELTKTYGYLISSIFNNLIVVDTLEEALQHDSKWKAIVENDKFFSETLFVEMIIKNQKLNSAVSTKHIHLLNNQQSLDNCEVDTSLEKLATLDVPPCKDITSFSIKEIVSPWVNNLFAFNTEVYKNPFPKIENKKFDHYVMVASGWLWGWLLTANKWDPKKEYLTLFDISGTNLLHIENIIAKWSPWDQTFTDFMLGNTLAKEILIYSGWIEGGDEVKAREHLNDLWKQEMIRWASLNDSQDPEVGWDLFCEFFRKLQYASHEGKLSYVNANIISDSFLVKKLSTLTKGRAFWFISNIFTSYASRMWSAGSKDNELVWYETFKKKLNKDDVIFGRWPYYENRVIKMAKNVDVI